MKESERKIAAKNFASRWRVVDGERANYQKFWLTLIRDLFGIDKPENFVSFEVPVQLAHTKFIDAYFPDSKVIVEQKNFGVDLEKEITQSDGSKLTPHEQAKRYITGLPLSMHPRWIVTCNFAEFLIYDMETLAPPTKIFLSELPEKFHALDFLVDETQNKIRVELELSLKAGEIVGKLYDALRAQYRDPDSDESLVSLNKLCVRLVFCLYAESSGIFGAHKIFRDYLGGARNIRRDLLDLFEVLDTPVDERDPYLDDALKKFPFVNGGLFRGSIEIPNFTPEIKNLLLEEAGSGFNWSGISPTIFGAVFESTLNPVTRRAGGMHYTSVENIHKVIDPLFLDDLKAEFKSLKTKKQLAAFHEKISAIKIFDPACGSGNFLTESYLSLRRLENEVLKKILGDKILLGAFDNPIKVSIAQFYGIEINDFAVAVAQTALWIAELQMMIETQEIIHRDLDFLPLKSYSNIHEGNALRLDWKALAPDADFIIGNPPFVGHQWRTPEQVKDMTLAFPDCPKHGKLDYVAAWYSKTADFITGTKISCAFLSTNSIVQGEPVRVLWEYLFGKGVVINFAHPTFKWASESFDQAAVHCVVVGFAKFNAPVKKIFIGETVRVVEFINAYLLDAPNVFIKNRGNPPEGFPKMTKGSQPTDGGNLLLTDDECKDFLKREPAAQKFIRRYVGSNEFINGIVRWCLWLKDCPPNELRKMPHVMERLKKIREFRLKSPTASVRRDADTPALFTQIRQPSTNFLVVPEVSGERRNYIPIGFMTPDVIASNTIYVVTDATLYLFGVLTSSIHMAWMRTVAGRLESRYRYTPSVYYNFPWAEPSAQQKKLIESTAQKILDARKNYPQSTLADLYDELSMPKELRDAHKKNDRAVAVAYGFEKILEDESAVVGELLKLYARLTS